MSQRDITGKELYKEITFRPIKHTFEHYCFLAVQTKLGLLDFFVELFKQTNYLFELSAFSMDIVLDSQHFVFKVFQYQDPASEQFSVCLVNKDHHKENYLLSENTANACFVLSKNIDRSQLSFAFGDEEPQEEQPYDEQKIWSSFKKTMQQKSTGLTREPDFLFPINIQTYDILKPLFLEFANMENIRYRLILPHEIEQVDVFIIRWDYLREALSKENKEQ
ncbi:MAG: hypothetical protein LBH82_01240 [Bacteroidales bacterium]|jgi:hypothetical protein|nr:hypothetical protein [Bacteroidales bacterium]